MNKHLSMNRIRQNEEELDLLQGEWTIKGRDGWVSKDKTLRNKTKQNCYLFRLYIAFYQRAVYSHLWASVPKRSKENSEVGEFLHKYQKIYLRWAQLVSDLTNITWSLEVS